jgi:hypothetical protein
MYVPSSSSSSSLRGETTKDMEQHAQEQINSKPAGGEIRG